MTPLHNARPRGWTFDLPPARRRSLVLLLAGLGLSIGVPMALSLYVTEQFRQAQMLDVQAAGELLTEGFLSPHARRALRNGSISPAETQEMHADFDRIAADGDILGAVIWDLSGNPVYSSVGNITEEMFPQADYQAALKGQSSHVEVTDLDAVGRHDTVPLPYLELYTPIVSPDTGAVIAVGEMLFDISQILENRRHAARSVLIASGLASLALSAMVVLILFQRERLLQHLAHVRALGRQNIRLRRGAERARLLASHSNEALLNQLGAEIHDGPVQVLSLLMLSEDKNAPQPVANGDFDRRALISSVMGELRAISDGLILPEMDPQSLAGSLKLAIARHETLTGHRVAHDLTGLPQVVDPEFAVCLYRFVQEGLTNAFRHAGTPTERVTGRQDGDLLLLTVSDGGPGTGVRQKPVTSHRGLGLQGIRNRLKVFGGSITLEPNAEGGMDLTLRAVVAQPGHLMPDRD